MPGGVPVRGSGATQHRSDRRRAAKALALLLLVLACTAPASAAQDSPPEPGADAPAEPAPVPPSTPAAEGEADPPPSEPAAGGDGRPPATPGAPAGEADAEVTAPPDDPAGPADDPPGPAVSPPDEPSVRARRFTDALFRALVLEHQAQKYEREELGSLPIKSLKAERLDRRRRIDQDSEHFAERMRELPKQPLVPPTRGRDHDLRPLEALVVNRLERAYEASRELQRVKGYELDLDAFLKTSNSAARDRSVQTRDKLMATELRWLGLVERAEEIVTQGLSDTDLQAMLAELDELSPETADSPPSVITQLINDESVRMQVIGELQGLLSAPLKSRVPVETDAELLATLPGLHQALKEKSGLTETFAESLAVDTELLQLEEQLADRGVEAPSPDERRALISHKAELMVQRNRIRNTLTVTPPDPESAAALRDTQDALIRRRMFDLGARAALFGHRYDDLAEQGKYAGLPPGKIWTHLEEQAELISALDGARPAPNPLEGIKLDPTSLLAPPSKEALAKPLPKPKAGAKKKGPAKGGR